MSMSSFFSYMSSTWEQLFAADPVDFLTRYTVDPLGLDDWKNNLKKPTDGGWIADMVHRPANGIKAFKLWNGFGTYFRLQIDGSTFAALAAEVDGQRRAVLLQLAEDVGSATHPISAYYFPYLTLPRSPDDMGHVDIPINAPACSFAITGSMNGCALVVTDAPAQDGNGVDKTKMRVYHYPSPGSYKEFLTAAAESDYQWYTDVHLLPNAPIRIVVSMLLRWNHFWDFYDYAGPVQESHRNLGESRDPCAINMLWHDGTEWRILSQNQALKPSVTCKYAGKSVGLTLERTGILANRPLRTVVRKPKYLEAYYFPTTGSAAEKRKWLELMAGHLVGDLGWDTASVREKFESMYKEAIDGSQVFK